MRGCRFRPGEWRLISPQAGEPPRPADIAVLTLEQDGRMRLAFDRVSGEHVYEREGTWSFELVQDGLDRLTLRFAQTDRPLHEGGGEAVECVYTVYGEVCMEVDDMNRFIILEKADDSVSPFREAFAAEDDALSLHREDGPNARIVNCKNFVSLRAERSASSARLAKVPLGALVFAFPEFGEENGFTLCNYRGEGGYILSEYLERIQ